MAKYIDKEAALEASKIVYIEFIELDGEGYEEADADYFPVVFRKDIEAIPAADVRPVVHGKWVHGDEVSRDYIGDALVGINYNWWACSCCNWKVEYYQPLYNYCPNCGADMREERENG